MKLAAHCLVKNEARFVWFAVMSVIAHVDRVLLWDTGSIDGTTKILKEIKKAEPKKVNLRLLKSVTPKKFTRIRQQMLDETKADWFIVVDGDEVWWEGSIRKLVRKIHKKGDRRESIVVPTINLVGDMYHYQEEAAGLYHLAGRKGHLNLRAINRNIPGLHSEGPHGTWGWADEEGKQIQDRDKKKSTFLQAPYLHATFLRRAGKAKLDSKVPKRSMKLKHELGITFRKDYFYPEVFFRPRPAVVNSVWAPMDSPFYIRAFFETPLRKIKRRILPSKVGY